MRALTLLTVASLGLSTLALASGNQDVFENNNAWHQQNHIVAGNDATASAKAGSSVSEPRVVVAAAGGQDMFEANNSWHQQHRAR